MSVDQQRAAPKALIIDFLATVGLIVDRFVEVANGIAVSAHWEDSPPQEIRIREVHAVVDLADPGQKHAFESGEVAFEENSAG